MSLIFFFFFKQKTAYEIKECDWSSDVCSSDLAIPLNDNIRSLPICAGQQLVINISYTPWGHSLLPFNNSS